MTARSRSDETRALLQLDATPGVGLRTLARLVDVFGSAGAALAAPSAAFARVAGRDPAARRGDPVIAQAVQVGLAEAETLGMSICTWRDQTYPDAFRQLADPPPVLFLRGREEILGKPGVTIVGARKATSRARDVARRLGSALARAGVTVVSGMALGVDGAAHFGALEADGDTVAVLGRGADRAYPASHHRLFGDILERGLVVSEFLPGTPALPHHFPRRNRLLAALAHTVVVVEASRRSGALITVEHALDLGLDIFAVPGPIDQPSSVGSNALLADGARPLVSIEGFVRDLVGDREERPERLDGPGGTEGRLLSGLSDGPQHVEELADRVGLDVSEVLALLAALEMQGWVEQCPGLRFRRAG